MLFAGKMVMGVVGGGMLLGVTLAGFAKPVPIAPQEPAWAALVRPYTGSSAPGTYIEALPQDLTPRHLPDGYAPAFADSELAEVWQADFEMPAYVEYATAPTTYAVVEEASSVLVALQGRYELAVGDPSAPDVAAEASAAADEAMGAQEAAAVPSTEQPQTTPAGQARIIHVADTSGSLY